MFHDYSTDGFYDEMFIDSGQPRPHYRRLFEFFRNLDRQAFEQKRSAIGQTFTRQGITFNLYGDPDGTERIFPFDLFPRIIPGGEWNSLTRGLEQRITALNCFLEDVYSRQRILKEGVIPAPYVLGARHFRRECMDVPVARDIRIHVCGTDLIRDAHGTYRVLEDNARCPSGISSMLENRKALERAFPGLFREMGVRPVSDCATELLRVLHHIDPRRSGNPTAALLTPGVYNNAHFEHTFLARQMGIEVVEGCDLVVRDDILYMRTTRGLRRIDVLYRRINDDFLDPEVFRRDSRLGVPGLVRACRAGNLSLANSIGTGVADDKVLYAFVPAMIRFYLGEDPLLSNVQTYLASRGADRSHILENLRHLVVKSANEAGGYGMLMGPVATRREIEEWRRRIKADPRNFIAQPPVTFSRHPTWTGSACEGRHIDFRPFILNGAAITIPAGGLTRVALERDSLVVNSSQGGGSKDTWVLPDGS